MSPIGLASAALQAARRTGCDRVVVWSDDLAVADLRHDLVEATGLVVELGRTVMADALTALVTTGGLERGLSVAVNASPVELRREGSVAAVAAALAATGVTRGQGWLWWRALPVAEAAALLASQDGPRPAGAAALAADRVEPAP